ncbi:MAG: fumarylacetoacetate hydrolase family protein [Candidatus Aminicenantes bacterium]|nr:fumarylacetoacetate hydrolase family protein [Candidatus Aminicenantes bacterium]
MKIYRFKYKKKISYGILEEEILFPVLGSIYRKIKTSEKGIPISETALLPPVIPSKIVAVGRNYTDHASEMGNPLPSEPLLFLKPSSAVIGTEDCIIYPKESKRVDFEGELALIIKKKTHKFEDKEDVADYILGYTCFNDVTARDLQQKDIQFTRAKSFDTFASMGPCIATQLDPAGAQIKTFLNGKLKQSGNTKNLIFSIPELVRFVSRIMTLFPGDVLTTGTPAGVGPMFPGDRIDVQIQGIGTLSNRVE